MAVWRTRGGGADDDEESGGTETAATGRGARTPSGETQVASDAPNPVDSAKRNLPRGATFAQPAETAPQAVASNDADADTQSDVSPVTLHGPIAAQFIAPMPPRKPTEFVAPTRRGRCADAAACARPNSPSPRRRRTARPATI